MIETKNALAFPQKEEKATRWNELKFMEDEKWTEKLVAQAKMVKEEEHRLALEEERLAKEKKVNENAIMFMDPSMMDAMARKCWELAHEEILAQKEISRGGGGTRGGYGAGHGGYGGGHDGDGDGHGGDGSGRGVMVVAVSMKALEFVLYAL
ncbi:hypothetical protein ACQJBY_028209 [Aegilops geniculata]